MNRLRAFLLAVPRWVLILAVFLAAAEAFARLDDRVTWGAPILGPYNHDRLLVADSLGIHGRPNYRYQKWRMNNLGFRGPDIAPEPAPGRTRIAVLGASETFGLYETEGHEYAARLQQVLDSLAPGRYEVVNAGVPGLTVATMATYFRNYVAPIRPSLVLIYPSPSFYLWVTPPVETVAGTSLRPIGERDGSRLLDRSRDILKELVPVPVVTFVRERRLARERAAHEPAWQWSDVPDDRMTLYGEHLERLARAVTAAGARPVFVTHTNRFAGDPGSARGPDRRHLVNLLSVDFPRASEAILLAVDSVSNDVMRNVARRTGASVIEADGAIPPGARDFADYVHFTDAGADAMAHLLARHLLALAPDSARVAASAAP